MKETSQQMSKSSHSKAPVTILTKNFYCIKLKIIKIIHNNKVCEHILKSLQIFQIIKYNYNIY
jgi:hypothetical protein